MRNNPQTREILAAFEADLSALTQNVLGRYEAGHLRAQVRNMVAAQSVEIEKMRTTMISMHRRAWGPGSHEPGSDQSGACLDCLAIGPRKGKPTDER
jgi:hypothetical protein